jgi:flagellar hook-associated protein 2
MTTIPSTTSASSTSTTSLTGSTLLNQELALLPTSSSSTPLQNVGGLASGLNTNTIISQLLQIERQPEVLMMVRQSIEQKRSDTLTAINSQLVSLQNAEWKMRDVTVWANSQTVSSTDSQNLTATQTGGSAAGGYEIQVTQLARADQVTQGAASGVTSAAGDDTLHIQVGQNTAADVQVSAGDNLSTIASKINANASSQVYASVLNNKLVLSGKLTGAANTIAVTSDGGLAASLAFSETLQPKNAQYTLDGVRQSDSASNIVTSAIPGVSLTFTGTMATPATVNVSTPGPNTTTITNTIQNFVTQYNSTIDMISSAVNERKVANPQSQADQTAGALNGDPQLEGLMSTLRQSVTGLFGGRTQGFSTMAAVGLSTGHAVGSGTISDDSLEGKLTLDATKLASTLASNFNDVKSLFTNITADPSTQGLAQRLDGVLTPQVQVGGVMASRIFSEATTINDLKQQQADVETRVALRETQLRTQFTHMETAMAQAQSIMSQLTSQINGLNGSSR